MDDSTSERWLPVVGYEGLYEVSDRGRVRSLPRYNPRGGPQGGQILQGRPLSGSGYLRVYLCKGGSRRDWRIHRLVLLAFVGPCAEGHVVRHLDGDPARNWLTNLAYGTYSENSYDTVRHGRHHNASKTSCDWGHEFTTKNTRIDRRTGHRHCVQCQLAYEERNAVMGRLCECGKPVHAKGMCQKHYDQQKWKNHKKGNQNVGMALVNMTVSGPRPPEPPTSVAFATVSHSV